MTRKSDEGLANPHELLDSCSEAEERLHLAMQIGRMYAFEWNPQNDAVLRTGDAELIESLWGTSEDTGASFLSKVHPEDREPFHRIACQLTLDRPNYQISYRFIHDNASIIWLHERGQAFYDAAGQLLRVVGVTADITKSKETEESIRELGGRLLSAQEEERQRIARELHDDIGQELAVLVARAQRAIENSDNEAVRSQINEIYVSAQEAGRKISRLSHQLHASELDYVGLPTALQMLCRTVSLGAAFELTCTCKDVTTALNRDLSIALYRVAQEALRNTAKHAAATRVSVLLLGVEDNLILRIQDNGRGFELDDPKPRGLGLISMRERIHLVGGILTVSSRPGEGTTIEAQAGRTASRR